MVSNPRVEVTLDAAPGGHTLAFHEGDASDPFSEVTLGPADLRHTADVILRSGFPPTETVTRCGDDSAVLHLGDGVAIYAMKEALLLFIAQQRVETNGRKMCEEWLAALAEIQPDDMEVPR